MSLRFLKCGLLSRHRMHMRRKNLVTRGKGLSARRKQLGYSLGILVALLFSLCGDQGSPQAVCHIRSLDLGAEALPLVMASTHGYDIKNVRQGRQAVPRIKVETLTPSPVNPGAKRGRKEAFLKTMLPMILQVNEKILADRQRLRELMARSYTHLSASERAWIQRLATRYKVSPRNTHELLHRLDIVPPSLALGQSVVESGWGGHPLAAKKNSPFGHRELIRSSTAKTSHSRYRLKTFDSLHDSIVGYIHNINTHGAYKSLREQRSLMRKKGETISGYKLASGLTRYSELGHAYVQKIQHIIRQNDLAAFDDAYLGDQFSPL